MHQLFLQIHADQTKRQGTADTLANGKPIRAMLAIEIPLASTPRHYVQDSVLIHLCTWPFKKEGPTPPAICLNIFKEAAQLCV